jgi:FtsH-binding integral membrane protein
MPRWLAHLLVIVGWLLTPVWAWAASHVGLWLGAMVALRLQNPIVMLAIAGTSALIFGFAVLWTWIRFMRRLPHLLSHHMAPREGTSEEHAAIAAAD